MKKNIALAAAAAALVTATPFVDTSTAAEAQYWPTPPSWQVCNEEMQGEYTHVNSGNGRHQRVIVYMCTGEDWEVQAVCDADGYECVWQ